MKAFIIYLEELSFTRRLAQRCLESAQEQGWDAQLFAGYFMEAGEVYMRSQGYNFFSQQAPHYDKKASGHARGIIETTKGTIGCAASHYALWHCCVELGENIAIFEHDALLTGGLPKYSFQDVLVLGPSIEYIKKSGIFIQEPDISESSAQPFRWLHKDSYTPLSDLSQANGMCMPTTLSYMLSPQGASKLLADVKRWGYAPVDRQIRYPVVDLQIALPTVARSQEGEWDVISTTRFTIPVFISEHTRIVYLRGMLLWVFVIKDLFRKAIRRLYYEIFKG